MQNLCLISTLLPNSYITLKMYKTINICKTISQSASSILLPNIAPPLLPLQIHQENKLHVL